jgi:hypothetical protein
MFAKSLRPEDVFTPRSPEVNADMYIERTASEQALRNALRGHLHIVIHGESGTGKSWLYKQSFSKSNVSFFVANLANASRLGSIAAELKNLVDRGGESIKTSYEEEKSASVGLGVASGQLTHLAQYEIGRMEPFEACLSFLRKKAGNQQAVLVFDNLEAAFDNNGLLKELADLIILCDDERYTKYKTKMLIVGVPSGIKDYYHKTPHLTTVSNRIIELPEVSRLSKDECALLVQRGFIDKLKYQIYDIRKLTSHVDWITNRIPQMVHAYCLEGAFLGESSRSLAETQISQIDCAWMSKSLSRAYTVAEDHMNERDTKAGRRNQTLYALSLFEGEQFKAPEIEALIRREFPGSTKDTALNVLQTLSQLAGTNHPIVRRSPKGDAFTFVDPHYRMVLRSMLRKTQGEKIEKNSISQNN